MSLPNDMQRISEALARIEAAEGSLFTTDPKRAARSLVRPQLRLVKPAADAMAADATAYTAAQSDYAFRAGRFVAAFLIPKGAAAADAANNATVNLIKADGLGGAATVVASYTSNVAGGSLAAGVFKALTPSATAANLRFNLGQLLGFNITKAGTGVVVPAFDLVYLVEWESVDAYPV